MRAGKVGDGGAGKLMEGPEWPQSRACSQDTRKPLETCFWGMEKDGMGCHRTPRTFLTTGRTHGFALSSRYAPIPWDGQVSSVLRNANKRRGERRAAPTYQIDLVGARIGLVSPHQPKEGVLGGLRDHLGGEACY